MDDKLGVPAAYQADAAWHDAPPDPLDDPDLYDGLMFRRVLGYGLDVLLIMAVLAGLSLIGFLTFGLLTPFVLLIGPLVPLVYHSAFIAHSGATPGMAFMDVEVRAWDGRRPDYLQAFIMTVVFYLTAVLTSWLVLLVALFNDRHRTLHDYLSGLLALRSSRLRGQSGRKLA